MIIAHTFFGILIFGSSWFPRSATLALASAFLITMYRQTLKLDPTIRMEKPSTLPK